jgi:hypothetical protein
MPRARILSRSRILFAVAVAVVADGLQFITGPAGWFGVDQVIDVVAMALTMWALGFHLLLLPTFAIKLVPVVEELPTWTACVIAVVVLRKRAQHAMEKEAAILESTPPLPLENQRP